jgi:hypothetical protein
MDYIILIAIPVAAAALIGIGRWLLRAIRREVREVVVEVVQPELDRIHARIDTHMDEEEEGLRALTEVLGELAGLDVDRLRGRLERRLDSADNS